MTDSYWIHGKNKTLLNKFTLFVIYGMNMYPPFWKTPLFLSNGGFALIDMICQGSCISLSSKIASYDPVPAPWLSPSFTMLSIVFLTVLFFPSRTLVGIL